MSAADIRVAVEELSNFIGHNVVRSVDDYVTLENLLDKIAYAQHFSDFAFDESEHPDPPEALVKVDRAAISERFPNFGYYNMPEHVVSRIGESGCVVADAIDDLVDISRELKEVLWRWDNTNEADALWCFQNSYRNHWREHLRGLLMYLHNREWE